MSVTPDLLLRAYRTGIFPMAERRDDPEIFWVDPRRRGILPLDGFHMSRSLAKRVRHTDFRVTLNRDFAGVITACADRQETWINPEIERLYQTLFEQGHAQSLEIWQEGRLVGGVYGVSVGRAFCGESMFSRIRDASKIALAYLTCHLTRTGFTLFDTQFLTPHLQSLGGIEVTRAHYKRQLMDALEGEADMSRMALPEAEEVVAHHRWSPG